jgi:hypothetical protein
MGWFDDLKDAFEEGVKESLEVFKGEKSLPDAASDLIENLLTGDDEDQD